MTNFRPAWANAISCRPAWRGNSLCVALFRRACEKRITVVPMNWERRLPPPPPNCEHLLVGGHLILLKRRRFLVVDVFHCEVNSSGSFTALVTNRGFVNDARRHLFSVVSK
jgi:hypothetical protein